MPEASGREVGGGCVSFPDLPLTTYQHFPGYQSQDDSSTAVCAGPTSTWPGPAALRPKGMFTGAAFWAQKFSVFHEKGPLFLNTPTDSAHSLNFSV